MIQQELGAPIVDTHVHLDDDAFAEDRDAVVESARDAGVRAFVNIGYSPERWESSERLRSQNQDVFIAIGLHPHLADQFSPSVASMLENAVHRLRPVAIGEMGLDFAPGNPPPDIQDRAFRAQLELAAAMRLPSVIHQRGAADELMSALEKSGVTSPIVLHSFDGTPRLTRWAIERRAFVGIGGLATRRAAGPLRDLLAAIPMDQLLLETDAPYLVPAGIRSRRNAPANLPYIAAQLAPLWGLSAQELCRITTVNARCVFNLAIATMINERVESAY